MMLCRYEYNNSWQEALGIFLFSKLIIEDLQMDNIHILDYALFELKDTTIANYNQWFSTDQNDMHRIQEWITKNREQINDFETNFSTKYKPKVELWSDRDKTEYFKDKLQAAFEFENFIAEILKENYGLDIDPFLTPEGQYDLGENALGIEIKNDTLIPIYGNVYIEVAEKSNPNNEKYVLSGIAKKDNSKYWLIGDKSEFFIFRKERLVEIYKEEYYLNQSGQPSKRGIKFKTKPTSQGIVYPVKNAIADIISLDTMVNEIKANK